MPPIYRARPSYGGVCKFNKDGPMTTTPADIALGVLALVLLFGTCLWLASIYYGKRANRNGEP